MEPRHYPKPFSSERGIALVLVMLLLVLTSAILAGFLVTTTGDVRLRAVDRTRTEAFYSAHAALEKLTADLGNLFTADFSPSVTSLTDLEAAPPNLEQIEFVAADNLGYDIGFRNTDANPTTPDSVNGIVASGPFAGFVGLITPYTLTVTSRTAEGAEARLQRTMQTVAIPVFQFGVFSQTDLTFSANQTFNFGGRVHTNGNLFLAAATGGRLYITEKVTAAGEIVRANLANTRPISPSHVGEVYINRSTGNCTLPGTPSPNCRLLTATEGSITGFPGASGANGNWMNIYGQYNGYLRNAQNGVLPLNLPLVAANSGGQPIDLIRRPVNGENALLTTQRLYDQAAIRILLSDAAADITGLPNVSAGLPVQLIAPTGAPVAGTMTFPPVGAAYNIAVDANAGAPVWFHPPTATSSGVTNDGYRTPNGTQLLNGFLKIEFRAVGADGIAGTTDDTWNDVTMEWLNLGFTRRNIDRATQLNTNTDCATQAAAIGGGEPNPDAILRLQRVRQRTSVYNAATATTASNTVCLQTLLPTDYWPLMLYDTREGLNRDNEPIANDRMYMGGVMQYVDLDVNNLRRWIQGQIPGQLTGANLVANDGGNGFAVYFSDRRGNNDGGGNETGEWGWENFINPGMAAGQVNASLDLPGEDVNMSNTFETYGGTPQVIGGALAPFTGGNPFTIIDGAVFTAAQAASGNATNNSSANMARTNPSMFFRRALKLSNGAIGSLPAQGLTIASENPVYVEGNYNAAANGWGANNAPAAIMADAITLLSANWNVPLQVGAQWYGHGETRSFRFPHDPDSRIAATNTWYRFATLSGKGRNWTQTGTPESFGTDGGVHNFMRLFEDWGASTLNYRGSLASFYYSRQALGLFRCCTNVYKLPARNMTFDTNFLNPALLPPKTPMFRDVNTTGFVHITNRTQ